jgi:threonine/homoserine/homoserine lactone efflux protein
LGLLFAVSFCPVSAALFFGSLLPLAVERQSTIVLPTVFGVGTALPVLLFAILLAAGAKSVGAVFQQLTRFEWWARQATGIALLLIGLYLTLHHVFRMI